MRSHSASFIADTVYRYSSFTVISSHKISQICYRNPDSKIVPFFFRVLLLREDITMNKDTILLTPECVCTEIEEGTEEELMELKPLSELKKRHEPKTWKRLSSDACSTELRSRCGQKNK